MKQGLRFCVGNGSSINARVDPWLQVHPPRPPRLRDTAPVQLTVQDLMNSTRTAWDTNKLNDWILHDDINTILQIKLCATADEDLLGWHYTVKSAYWLATHLQTSEPIQPPPGNNHLKQLVWKLKTAPNFDISSGGFFVMLCQQAQT